MAVVLSAFCGRQWNNLLLTSIYRWMPAQSSAGTCTEQCSRGQYEMNDWSFSRTIQFEDWGNTKLYTYVGKFSLALPSMTLLVGRSTAVKFVRLQIQVVQSFKESLYRKRPHWNCFSLTERLAQMIIKCPAVHLTRHCVYEFVCFIIGA